jgi:4-hydroxythreonine-4-phosphate dehydrogenase
MSTPTTLNQLPRIAITTGDAAGVGPELALRCVSNPAVTQRCIPIVLGPAVVMSRIARRLQLAMPPIIDGETICSAEQACLVDCGELNENTVDPGHFSAATGRASFVAVTRAIDLAIAGKVAGLVTGPIQKEAWHDAGIEFTGHTELLADRTGIRDYCMMLTSETISCVLATIHIPLADVASQLSKELVLRAIRLGADAARRKHQREPRITVCGLNPHAGENGLFSHGEETEVITPAIEDARRDGAKVVGPLPPDTAFTPAWRAKTDVYVCMYHDQGLIPLKALSFDSAVNVTLGLPIVRTSVDHGTALDLAWQGKASDRSMLAAIGMAIDLSHATADVCAGGAAPSDSGEAKKI